MMNFKVPIAPNLYSVNILDLNLSVKSKRI